MIGGLGNDHALAAGGDLGDTKGEIVGLAAGADEGDLTDRLRKSREQSVGVSVHDVIEIARVDVENARLARDCLRDAGMTMPDRGDIIVYVQIAAALRVLHPDALGSNHADWLFIKQHRAAAEMAKPAGNRRTQRRVEVLSRRPVEGVQGQDFLARLHDLTLARSVRDVAPSSQDEESSTI